VDFKTSFTDKLVAISLYSALLIVTVWAGSKAINKTLDQMFITSFIQEWQRVVMTLQIKHPKFPPMTNKQLVAGMNKIEQFAQNQGISLPDTNTNYSYAHVLKKLGQPDQKIFLIAQPDHLTIYGIRQQTMERIDQYIDGSINPTAGKFTAKRGRNRETYTGILSL
jgi:hypothetical protein